MLYRSDRKKFEKEGKMTFSIFIFIYTIHLANLKVYTKLIVIDRKHFIKYWPVWFKHCRNMWHICLPNASQSCDWPDWLIQYCLSSTSSRVPETVSMKMPCGECFQKCFDAYNIISLWLNTVIPIIVMIWLPKMNRYLQWRIIYRHLTLVTF